MIQMTVGGEWWLQIISGSPNVIIHAIYENGQGIDRLVMIYALKWGVSTRVAIQVPTDTPYRIISKVFFTQTQARSMKHSWIFDFGFWRVRIGFLEKSENGWTWPEGTSNPQITSAQMNCHITFPYAWKPFPSCYLQATIKTSFQFIAVHEGLIHILLSHTQVRGLEKLTKHPTLLPWFRQSSQTSLARMRIQIQIEQWKKIHITG